MPELIVKLGDTIVKRHVFGGGQVRIGRGADNEIVLENLSVSRLHAEIRLLGDRYVLTDMESANGTFVNGVRIAQTEILNGDAIGIGKHILLFVNKAAAAAGADFDEKTALIDAAPKIALLVLEGPNGETLREYALDRPVTLIGKGEECDVRLAGGLAGWFVKKRHAVIRRQGETCILDGADGPLACAINGQTIRKSHGLRHGDLIKIGPARLRFRVRS